MFPADVCVMTASIRAVVSVASPGSCPLATASRQAEVPIHNPARSTVRGPSDRLSEEFTVPRGTEIDPSVATPVFETDQEATYRFERYPNLGCVCEAIERHGPTVSSVAARDGTLHLTFFVDSHDDLMEIVEALRNNFDGVEVQQLARSYSGSRSDLVSVDRSALTPRQREVLETSLAMGYFDHPKGANAGDVAAALEISTATLREHLAVAQGKLLSELLGS